MTTPEDGTPGEAPQDPIDPATGFPPPPAASYPPAPGYPPPPAASYPPPPAFGAPPPGYPGAPVGPAKQNSKALWSLISGIVGFCICGIVFGIVAIFLGRQAKQEIAASGGAQSGAGLAQAGFILGIIAFAFGFIQLIYVLTQF